MTGEPERVATSPHKRWTERLGIISTILAILGLTVWGLVSQVWEAFNETPTRTRLVVFDPWRDRDAASKAKLEIGNNRAECNSTNIIGGWGAQRCFVGDMMYQTCFPPSDNEWSGGEVRACASAPWGPLIYVQVARFDKKAGMGYLLGEIGSYSQKTLWAFQLANGDRCVREAGTREIISGRPSLFSCERGEVLAVNDKKELWMAEYFGSGESESENLPIEIAWF
jgi:hypothetical protein